MSKVQLYTTTFCPFCLAAKAILDQKGVNYDEIDLSSEPDIKSKIMEEYKWSTVPIIVIDDELIGGYRELKALVRTNKLDEKLGLT
ncbi:MAG: glutaredoxin [Candidatus Dadabacteria bacterium]|nr:glutaredoxin [Candidatus Dadabacteria bacterium]